MERPYAKHSRHSILNDATEEVRLKAIGKAFQQDTPRTNRDSLILFEWLRVKIKQRLLSNRDEHRKSKKKVGLPDRSNQNKKIQVRYLRKSNKSQPNRL